MPNTEVMIPPWVRAESPDTFELLDDQSVMFQPQFGRNLTQVQSWSDPRWKLHRKYSAMRLDERSMLVSTILETRGKALKVYVTPNLPLRGSFPATEVFTNGTFVNSTNGWLTSDTTLSLYASERMLRVIAAANGDTVVSPGLVSVSSRAPYLMRVMTRLGRVSGTDFITSLRMGTTSFGNDIGESSAAVQDGYKTQVFVPLRTDVYPGLVWYRSNYSIMPNDFFHVNYISLARCMLVDVGTNKLLNSEALSNATWSATNMGSTLTNTTAPNGTATADVLVENTAAGQHYITTATPIVVPGAPGAYTLSAALKAGTKAYGRLAIAETTSATIVGAIFNLNSGTVGTTATGANWSGLATFVNSLGGGWWECAISANKINAAPSLNAFIMLANSMTNDTYTGSSQNIIAWRPTLSSGSFPGRLINTGSSADDGGSPNGGAAHIRGGPLSQNGLLLPYDWVEFMTNSGSELKQVTAPFNTDAFGRGYLQFRPGLSSLVGADAAVAIQDPFGRFRMMDGTSYDDKWGLYVDANLDLTEAY